MSNSFFDQGLKFSCTQCSDCCRHDPGIVLLSKSDLQNLGEKTKLIPRDFLKKFCLEVHTSAGSFFSLKEKSNNDCIFWNNGCSVYEARPFQCRSYPFWPRIIESKLSWEAESRNCPGIGNGAFHNLDEIRGWLVSRDENLPLMCDETLDES